MELNKECLKKQIEGVNYPKYDVLKVVEETKKNPIWLHFGAGNIFRGFIARLADDMLNKGLCDRGIIASETFDYEIITDIYDKCDNLTLIVDFNHFQAFGSTNSIINQSNLEERLKAFGFDAHTINGHDFKMIERALMYRSSLKYLKQPVAIIANTVKGKGVSFMENKLEWHYKSPNDEQLEIALHEIEEKY